MKHRTAKRFWDLYTALPEEVRRLADKNFDLLKKDSSHPSLHFKKVGKFWSARVGLGHRALAVPDGDDFVWVWIGTHDEYDRLI
ncbi:MAG: hypothetical protein IT426_10660 [Pirellulales bacterium]|nr:hypothetical protein [Pirellulales bacterium]